MSRLKNNRTLYSSHLRLAFGIFCLAVLILLAANFLGRRSNKLILISSPRQPKTAQEVKKKTPFFSEPNYVKDEVLVKLKTPLRLKSTAKWRRDNQIFASGGSVGVSSFNLNNTSTEFQKTISDLGVTHISTVIRRPSKQKFLRPNSFQHQGNNANLYKFKLKKNAIMKQVIAKLNVVGEVEYAVPNYIFTTNLIPNDPYFLDSYPQATENRVPNYNPNFDYQWDLKQINMPAVWNKIKNLNSPRPVKVAVIDSGIDYHHPELGSCDLDQLRRDLCPSILPGYNFIDNNDDPIDQMGHGTFVAGLIVAQTNNGQGIAGMSLGKIVRILPVKIFGSRGTTTLDIVASAIIYAADQRVDVINMSFGTQAPVADIPLMREALDYAYDRGIVLVAAAGNSGSDLNGFWPATYRKVISVGAVNYRKELASFSNKGYSMDLVAPGEKLVSLRAAGTDMYCSSRSNCNSGHIINGDYYYASGTSFSSPEVAAAAAIILAKMPNLRQDEVAQLLRSGADDLGQPGIDGVFGSGMLNVDKSLSFSQNNLPPIAKIETPSTFQVFSSDHGTIDIKGTATGKQFSHYRLLISLDTDELNWREDNISLANQGRKPVSRDLLGQVDVSNLKTGTYLLQLVVYNQESGNGQPITSATQVSFAIDSSLLPGFPRPIGGIVSSSPIVADINNDGEKEIITVNTSGNVSVIDSRGFYLPGWPKKLAGGLYYSLPTVADIDNDGYAEIIFNSLQAQKLYILNYKGQLLKAFNTKSRYATPVVGYFLSDKQKQVLVWDHDNGTIEIYSINKPLLNQKLVDADSINNPAVADLNGDGYDEIVITARRENSEDLMVFSLDKSQPGHFTARAASNLDRKRWCGPFLTAPSLADIDGDGQLEAVVTCGGDGINPIDKTDTNHIMAFDVSIDKISFKWDYAQIIGGYRSMGNFNPPALVDFNQQFPGLEILSSASLFNLTEDGMMVKLGLLELDHQGKLVNFTPYKDFIAGMIVSDFPIQAPIAANLDQDSDVEVVIPTPNNHQFPIGKSFVMAFNQSGTAVAGWPKIVETEVYGTPVLTDVNGDGYNEVVAVSMGGLVYVWRTQGRPLDQNRSWPQKYYDNYRRSSVLSRQPPVLTPTQPPLPTPTQPIIQIPDSIVVQAENTTSISSAGKDKISVRTSSQASFSNYLLIQKSAGRDYGGDSKTYVEYRIKVDKAGWYTLWLRNKWPDWASNSVYVQLDDGRPMAHNFTQGQNSWSWKKGSRFYLSKGKHKLLIKNREGGVSLDVFVLTLNRGFNPDDYDWYIGYSGGGAVPTAVPTQPVTPTPTPTRVPPTPTPSTEGPTPVSGGYRYEFESCKTQVPTCLASGINLIHQTVFSGGQAIQFDPKLANSYGYNSNSDKKMEFEVLTPNAGKKVYYLWIKRKGPDYRSDSAFITVDGNYKTTLHFTGPVNQLGWQKLPLSLPTGDNHTLGFVMRESGAIFDSFVLTSDKTYAPTN